MSQDDNDIIIQHNYHKCVFYKILQAVFNISKYICDFVPAVPVICR